MTPCTCHPGNVCASAASCAAARRVEFGANMTTPQPAALPELPEPGEYFVHSGLDWHRAIKPYFDSTSNPKLALYTADQMRARDAMWVERLAALQSQPAASAIAEAIHYPDCWDQMAYPTLESALHELTAWFKCSNDECKQPAAAGVSDAELRKAIDALRDPDTVSAFYNGYFTLTPDELRRAILALRPQAVPVGFINKPIVWESRQSEMIVKITSKAQPAYGFTHPIYAESPRPQAVPMTDDAQRQWRFIRDRLNTTSMYQDSVGKFVEWFEAHHGITAQGGEG